MSTRPIIPEHERIPLLQKLTFSLGVNAEYVAVQLMTSVLWMPFFNIGLGMEPLALGAVLMILRLWEAFIDPVIGNFSDNARTRWGRRRPFIVVGALLTAALFPLFWFMPAGLGDTGKLVYLTGVGLVFFTCFATWAMPYYGFQMELTPNYDERTSLSAWSAVVSKLSYLGGSWVLALVTGPLFADPATGKGDIVHGMRTLCWFIAGLIVVFGILPVAFTKERTYAATAARQPREPFWQSVKDSAACRPLWVLIGVSFFLVLGYSSVASLANYIYIYYIFDGDINAGSVLLGWKATVNVATGLASIPLLTWLAGRYDKRTMVMAMLILCVSSYALNFVCLRPDMPYLMLVPAVFESCGISAVWLFLPSMKADVGDYDALTTGRRREGAINSFYSWFIKASLTASVGIGGAVLSFSGFSAKITHQAPEVLHRMLILFISLPIAFWAIAFVICLFYPLTRARMAAIRAELEARKLST
ncbi:MAG: MFS transporter [Opitutus sp.]|nr:MFS transporter [Opitutus sp.]MCS6246586.1 MFS transporter [Opitutus sp.]MCS6272730.1 MFS transporter [Opitutus sp.]MCS6276361.1 MFS transporter [Opitutus sp.]MCS6301991.1 MFS transporter [Opitutus sp.]